MDKVSAWLIAGVEVVLCVLGLTVLFAPRGCRIDVTDVATATLAGKVETYAMDCGRAPADLAGLVERDDCGNWLGPYAKPRDLVDPWGRRFVWLRIPDTDVSAICTFGADGVIGGSRDRCSHVGAAEAAIEGLVSSPKPNSRLPPLPRRAAPAYSKPFANNGPSDSTAPTSHLLPSGRGTPR